MTSSPEISSSNCGSGIVGSLPQARHPFSALAPRSVRAGTRIFADSPVVGCITGDNRASLRLHVVGDGVRRPLESRRPQGA